MVVEELQVDLLTQNVIRTYLYRQHLIAARSLCDTFVNLTEQHLHIFIRYIDLQFQVVAYLLLPAVFLLGNEVEVLNRITGPDYELRTYDLRSIARSSHSALSYAACGTRL